MDRGDRWNSSGDPLEWLLFGTWCRISRAKQEDPFPLTPLKIKENAATLRSAGYKAAKSYVYEGRDAKRVAEPAAGPALRSEEVRSHVWEGLLAQYGPDAVSNDGSLRAPNGGVWIWIVGSAFVLHEVELASLTLFACLEFNDVGLTATLKLPVSKCNPSGRGAARTLGSSCRDLRNWLCPFHALKDLGNMQCELLGAEDRSTVEPGSIPLVGCLAIRHALRTKTNWWLRHSDR